MTSSRWKKVKLGDICTLNYGKALTAKKRIDGNIPVYSSAGVTGMHNDSLVESEGVIIGRKGSIGTVYYSASPFFCIDTAYYVLPSKDYSLKYLFYRLKSLGLEALNEDSAVPGLNRETAYSQNFLLPPYDEQLEIESILSSLDDKIELNNQINKNLEEMAQAIFKSWFVDFEPFQEGEFEKSELGMIPSGWTIGYLADLIEVRYGKDHKKLPNGDIPVYGSGGLMRHAASALYTGESVLIPRKGTLSNIMYVDEAFWTVDTMFYSIMKVKGVAKYVHHFMMSKDLVSMNAGSAVPSMTTDILNRMVIIIPPEEVLNAFEAITAPMYQQMLFNKKEIHMLAELRDALLPKLMSGEIDLSQISI